MSAKLKHLLHSAHAFRKANLIKKNRDKLHYLFTKGPCNSVNGVDKNFQRHLVIHVAIGSQRYVS